MCGIVGTAAVDGKGHRLLRDLNEHFSSVLR
jgi:hypothetical protein